MLELLAVEAVGAGQLQWHFALSNSLLVAHFVSPSVGWPGELGPSICKNKVLSTGTFLLPPHGPLNFDCTRQGVVKWEYAHPSISGRYKRLNLKIHQVWSQLKELNEQE